MVYLALQVPEEQLNAGIPFPNIASAVEKTEPIPDPKTAVTKNPPGVGEVPAYALFYTTKPGGEEPSKLGTSRLRPRPKPAKRAPKAVKAKRSS